MLRSNNKKNIGRFDYKNKLFSTTNIYLKLKDKHRTGKYITNTIAIV